jgi:DNA-directed RNA polymerase specialized sigma subunit
MRLQPTGPERTARILRLRSDGRSLQEIGDAVGLSRQRVQVIIAKAAKRYWRAKARNAPY